MKEKKDQPIKVSTCFEESSSAEMMRKIMSEQGIGSLSEEMMRSLVRSCCEGKELPQETGTEEVGEGNNNPEFKTAQSKNKQEFTGGVK